VRRTIAAAESWAQRDPNVRCVLVVGSYAYGHPTPASDLDLVVLAAEPAPLTEGDELVRQVVGDAAEPVRERDWGPLRERRYRTAEGGLEVELGITPLTWLETPVDPGTARVLRDGCCVLADPDGLAEAALRSLGLPVRAWTPDLVATVEH
jgi:hypothetical protein